LLAGPGDRGPYSPATSLERPCWRRDLEPSVTSWSVSWPCRLPRWRCSGGSSTATGV